MDVRGRLAALLADDAGDTDEDDGDDGDGDGNAEVRDRTRYAAGRVTLADRLTAAVGREVTVATYGADAVRGPLNDTAPEWLLVGETLVPMTSVESVDGLGGGAEQPGPVRRRLSLGFALRALARDNVEVVVTLTDGATIRGSIGNVGADYVEVGTRAIRHAAIAALRPG